MSRSESRGDQNGDSFDKIRAVHKAQGEPTSGTWDCRKCARSKEQVPVHSPRIQDLGIQASSTGRSKFQAQEGNCL